MAFLNYFINISSNLIKILSGFIFFLLLSRELSSDDFGRLGQVMTLSSFIVMFATLGVQNRLIQIFSTNNKIGINHIFSLLILFFGFAILLSIISNIFFYEYALYFSNIGRIQFSLTVLTIFFIACFLQVSLSAFNGREKVKTLSVVNSLGGIISVMMAYAYFKFNLNIAIFYIVLLYPVIKVLFCISSLKYFKIDFSRVDCKAVKTILRDFSGYIVMAVTSTLLLFGSQFYIRELISSEISWSEVANWQILYKHSEIAMLFFTALASIFLIPKIANKTFNEQLSESFKFSKTILLLALAAIIFTYFLSDIYFSNLYNKEYLYLSNYLYLYLIGDGIRVTCYCFTMIVLVNREIKKYIFLECVQYALLLSSYTFFVGMNNTNYMLMANISTFSLFAIIVMILLYRSGLTYKAK